MDRVRRNSPHFLAAVLVVCAWVSTCCSEPGPSGEVSIFVGTVVKSSIDLGGSHMKLGLVEIGTPIYGPGAKGDTLSVRWQLNIRTFPGKGAAVRIGGNSLQFPSIHGEAMLWSLYQSPYEGEEGTWRYWDQPIAIRGENSAGVEKFVSQLEAGTYRGLLLGDYTIVEEAELDRRRRKVLSFLRAGLVE